MRPVFVRTRHVYDSYQDYWRLVELSGFETCFVDEVRLDREAFFIFVPVNGEVRPHLANERARVSGGVRARTAVWALERPDSPCARPWENEVAELRTHFDEVWAADAYMVGDAVRLVPLGSHADLGTRARLSPEYDVAFMGYMVPRRETIAYKLRANGVKVAPNGWGAERDRILRSTRIMLNVHQHERPAPIGEPLRFALAAAYALPLVTETIARPGVLTADYDVLVRDYGELVPATLRLLGDAPRIGLLGECLHHKLCVRHSFAALLEEHAWRPLGLQCA